MLVIGYLYGIKSERRLEEEVKLNIAYRWFCGLNINDKVPDHSTFSQNRRRRFKDSGIFRDIFNEIVIQCIDRNIVTGETIVSDGSFVPANVSKNSKVVIKKTVAKSTVSYLDELDYELSLQKGYRNPETTYVKKEQYKSSTDVECGYIAQPNKKGLGYLLQASVDTENGIVTGIDVYPSNITESTIVLRHIKKQMLSTGLEIDRLGLDAGYDVGAVHRGLEILGIKGYVSTRLYHHNLMKKGFNYIPSIDSFECKCERIIPYRSIVYKKSSQSYYRYYTLAKKHCNKCPNLKKCTYGSGSIRLNVSPFYPSFYANKKRTETSQYKEVKRLRSIWAEGAFAVLKREHNLQKTRKRGIRSVEEECLLAAIALNLKRMAKAVLLSESLMRTFASLYSKCHFQINLDFPEFEIAV